jgi:hypothetical protein
MQMTPSHRNRDVEKILSEHIFHDAIGFGYRAASWIDYAKRTGNFAALNYACIDERLSIEHLIFEQIVITTEPALTEDNYRRCLSEPRKLHKLLNKIVPDYEQLLDFTEIVTELSPGIPRVNKWKIKELMKSWGDLSAFLHWTGAHVQTTEALGWQRDAIKKASNIIEPLWEKMSSGRNGSIRVDSMPPNVRDVWDDFRVGKISPESARIRLKTVWPQTEHYQA